MDEDYYQTGSSNPGTEEEKGEDAGKETALLPRSMFAGKELEPGAECKIKVESIMGDEVEVSYVRHEEKKEEKAEEEGESAESAIDRGIEAMRGM